jgi:DNA transformation protein
MATATLNHNLKKAKNIGTTILRRLNEIGVYSMVDLAEISSVGAYNENMRSKSR